MASQTNQTATPESRGRSTPSVTLEEIVRLSIFRFVSLANRLSEPRTFLSAADSVVLNLEEALFAVLGIVSGHVRG